MIQRHLLPTNSVKAICFDMFVIVTPLAGKGEIIESGGPPVMAWRNVFDGE